jgi:predicted nucleotidyltransferase
MTRFRSPTPYDDVDAVLHHFVARRCTILESQFLGMCQYGSLALGDFDPHTSDVDFIVVTKNAIADDLYTALQAMHAQFIPVTPLGRPK